MIAIPNQPVSFNINDIDNPYIDNVKYKQLVQQGDVTQIQFWTGWDFNTENLLTNPGFSQNLDGWILPRTAGQNFRWDNGALNYIKVGTSAGASIITQQAMTVGVKYECTINIVRSLNMIIEVYFGTSRIAQLTAGIHRVSGLCVGSGQFKIIAIPKANPVRDDTPFVTSIDYVYLTQKAGNNHKFVIEDVEDGTVATVIDAVASLSDPYTEGSECQFTPDYLTLSVDWQTLGIANGCYKIGVCDADLSTYFQNGCRNQELYNSWTDSDGNVQVRNWVISTTGTGVMEIPFQGLLRFKADGGAGTVTLRQDGLKVGATYQYNLDIQSITGGSVTVSFGTTAGTSHTTTGIKGETIACAGNNQLTVTYSGNAQNTVIGYIRIQMIDADLTPDYYSNPFYLADTHNRTVLINANNRESVFGLQFGYPNFTPRIRIRGYIAPDNNAYTTERNTSESAKGLRDVYYFKRRKAQILVIESEPRFIHDFLSLLGGFDHVMVDNIEYFINEDDYPPVKWGEFRLMGGTQLPISEKWQLSRKVVKGKLLIPQFIQDADGDGNNGGYLGDPDSTSGISDAIGNVWITDPQDPTIYLQTPRSPTDSDIDTQQ